MNLFENFPVLQQAYQRSILENDCCMIEYKTDLSQELTFRKELARFEREFVEKKREEKMNFVRKTNRMAASVRKFLGDFHMIKEDLEQIIMNQNEHTIQHWRPESSLFSSKYYNISKYFSLSPYKSGFLLTSYYDLHSIFYIEAFVLEEKQHVKCFITKASRFKQENVFDMLEQKQELEKNIITDFKHDIMSQYVSHRLKDVCF